MLPPTPTQHYLVLITLQRIISFVMSFTISRWLKKYYYYDTFFIERLTIDPKQITLLEKDIFWVFLKKDLMESRGKVFDK